MARDYEVEFTIQTGIPIEQTDTYARGPKRNPLRLAIEKMRPGDSMVVPSGKYTRKNIRDNVHTIRKSSKDYDYLIRTINEGWRVHCVEEGEWE